MSLKSQLERLEHRAGITDAPPCTHVISITNEGEPVPPSRCDCAGEHINVVVCRVTMPPYEAPYEPRDTTPTT
ncbi:MAG: hypothetical protein H0W76_22705 [Pyrinomonadaceae bacterium]|nr:hypothetical protein [Pyrinomonadaceae bacterium]